MDEDDRVTDPAALRAGRAPEKARASITRSRRSKHGPYGSHGLRSEAEAMCDELPGDQRCQTSRTSPGPNELQDDHAHVDASGEAARVPGPG